MTLAAGTCLGAYQIISPLGVGGMGKVYRARDTKLNRDVALKVLPEAFASDNERVARFAREAQTLATLNHPHIAQIYGLEEIRDVEGPGFSRGIVMALVDGEDLAERTARGNLLRAFSMDVRVHATSFGDVLSTARRKATRRPSRHLRNFLDSKGDNDRYQKGASGTQQIVAAVFNTSPDIVDLLRRALEPAGIVTVSVLTHQIREGVADLEGFLRQHDPDVIVYDIAPPYDANWHLFQHVCRMELMRDRPVVITSINARHVEKLAGRDQRIYEVVGKPYDLGQIVRAVKEASRARPTR